MQRPGGLYGRGAGTLPDPSCRKSWNGSGRSRLQQRGGEGACPRRVGPLLRPLDFGLSCRSLFGIIRMATVGLRMMRNQRRKMAYFSSGDALSLANWSSGPKWKCKHENCGRSLLAKPRATLCFMGNHKLIFDKIAISALNCFGTGLCESSSQTQFCNGEGIFKSGPNVLNFPAVNEPLCFFRHCQKIESSRAVRVLEVLGNA